MATAGESGPAGQGRGPAAARARAEGDAAHAPAAHPDARLRGTPQ